VYQKSTMLRILFGTVLCTGLFAGCVISQNQASRAVEPVGTNPIPADRIELVTVENVFNPIFTNDLSKSQFETQAEHGQRLARLQPPARTVSIEVSPSLVVPIYNAEKQRLAVMLEHSVGTELGQSLSRESLFTLRHSWEGDRRRNAGATYQINVENFAEMPVNTRWRATENGRVALGLPVTIDAQTARGLVERKQVTLILAVTIGDLKRAWQFVWRTWELPVHVKGLAVLNKASNTILVCWPATGVFDQ
jgi:hypothetical protein